MRPKRWGRGVLIGGLAFMLLVVVAAAIHFLTSRDPQDNLRDSLRKAAEFAKKDKHEEAITFYKKALLLAPDDERIRRAIAASYVRLNKIPKAISEYKEYLQHKPNDRAAQLVLAQLYLLTRNLYEAKRITDSILRINPEDVTALTVRAQCRVREEQLELAAEDLQKIIHKVPGWAPPYLAMAGLELKNRNVEEAEDYLKRAVSASPENLGPVIALGRFYAMQNRMGEAEAVFRNAVEGNQRSDEARGALAMFLSTIGRFDEALAQYQRVLERNPKNVSALIGSAGTALSKGDIDSATKSSARLLKLKSGRLPGLYYRGFINLLNEKPNKAVQDLLEVVEKDRDNAAVHYLLGIAYLRKNEVSPAKSHLTRALQIDPAMTQAQLVLAEVLMATGNLSEAVDEAEAVLKKQADNFRALLIAGQGYLLQRAPEKAEPYFEKSVQVEEKAVFGRMVLARIYRETGKASQAVEAYEEVIRLNPSFAIPHYLLGTLYYDMGDYENAVESYRAAVEKDPTFPAALNNLAFTYAEHGGDLDEAQKLIEPLAEKFPEQASIQDTFAWVLFKKGMYAESLRILESISDESRMNRTLIGYHYALALYKNDRGREARPVFERVLPSIQDDARKREIETILSEIGTKT